MGADVVVLGIEGRVKADEIDAPIVNPPKDLRIVARNHGAVGSVGNIHDGFHSHIKTWN